MNLIHFQYAEIQNVNPARGKGYTDGSSFITKIVISNKEAKINPISGAFCACVCNHYLESIYRNWKKQSLPIEGIKFRSASQDMHPLGILEADMISPNPAGSIKPKVEFVVMNN
ncbi:hypothetical protein O181_032712 [Austropuccinia psidii MF-1]|uniref:Uncharacterized protein n=1 Tax=Austropuccinia psidii MF-1 TaxID=1389203 RepID=A0A9Q3CZZ7_9BASI|nr:hypothetical protein [Austropuccinia psidii MF-1]